MKETVKLQIGWTENLDEIMYEFPAIRTPVECYKCGGDGKTVPDNLRGLDFTEEQLKLNGDWWDYVGGEGIWTPVTCSKCRGQGCYMETSLNWDEAKKNHKKQLDAMIEISDEREEYERETRMTMWGESGGMFGSPH